MRDVIISEELVHDAVDYLTNNSQAAATAKGHQVRADYARKRMHAKLILRAPHTTHGMRVAWADGHADYEEICNKLAEAEEAVEYHRNMRSRAETICEMWRTEQATLRGLRRVA